MDTRAKIRVGRRQTSHHRVWSLPPLGALGAPEHAGSGPPPLFEARPAVAHAGTNLLVRWGHTLPVGSDPDHPGILVQVLVEGTPSA